MSKVERKEGKWGRKAETLEFRVFRG